MLSPDSISVAVSVVGSNNPPVQVGQTLVATASITGDATDVASPIAYQWQALVNGVWTDVSGALAGNFDNGQPSSFLQLTQAELGGQFRVQASFTDDTGQQETVTSAATAAVVPVTPEITLPFTYAIENLTIVKGGSQVYDNSFTEAPPASPKIESSSGPTSIVFDTLGSFWSEGTVNGNPAAILSSSGVALSVLGTGNADVVALLNTNTSSAAANASQGLKVGVAFSVSSTFELTALPKGSYGMQLTDGTSTHSSDEVVSLVVQGFANGTTAVELLQENFATGSTTTLDSQTLTSTQLADDNQIEFTLTHTANASTVTGSFELLDNGVVDTTNPNSSIIFASLGTAFNSASGGNNWTRVAVLASTTPGVGVNYSAGQSVHVGQTLIASASTNDPAATLNYQWQESTNSSFTAGTITSIGADSSSYTLQSTDAGDFIRVVVSTSDPGNSSASETSAVTGQVAAAPMISVPGAQTLSQGQSTAIPNVSVSETGNATGETFTVTLTDTSGDLSANTLATGGGGTITGAGTTDLVISGTLGQLNADLTTLTDADATAGSDTITANATDSFDNSATTQTIGVTVTAGQNDNWINASGGTWTDIAHAAANWSTGAVPLASQAVMIGETGTYDVTIPSGQTAEVASLTLDSTNATLSDQGTLTLNGALTIDAGTFQLADGGTFAGATSITNAGTIEFAESFTLANSITNTGTLQVDAGETLTLVGVTISGGTLSTASTGAIDVTGTSTLSGMTVNGGAIADSGTLNIAGLVTLEGGANITGGAMSIGSGATLDADTPSGSDTLIDVTVSIANTGTLKVDPATGAMLVLSGGTTVTGGTLWINIAGTVQVGAGGAALDDVAVTDDKTLSISASTTLSASSGTAITGGVISDLGTLEANGGLVTVSAGTSISGSGNVEVTNSGTADFLDAFNQAVTFSGAGMLELAQSTSFSAAVTGFNSGSNSGDVIDLQDVAYAVSDYTVWTQTSTSGNGSGTLQVYDGTTLERTLNLAGMYSSGNFALTADSGTGTEVIASPTTVTVSGLTSGNAEQGDLVMVSLGASLSNVTYTWLLDGQVVLGDSTDSYTPAYADQGKTLDVVVNFTDPTTGNTDEVTGVAGTVQANPNDLHWNNSAGGNWTTATDWTPNTVPNSTTQIAFIDASGTYTVNITSTVTVGGLTDASSTATLEINGGTLNADGAASITNLILTGTNNGSGGGAGTLQGSGTVDITNTLTSSGFAEMGGSGTTILDAGSTGSTLDFGLSRTLEIGGSATVLANNSVNVGGDGGVGMVEVLSGGTLTLQSGSGESDAALANSGSGNSVSNAGDLIESGSGLRRIDVALTNTGTVDAQSGTLDINGGGSSSGILQAEAGATLAFATGSFTLAANSQLNDAGNLTVTNNGTLTTDPTDQVSVSGALIVTSGGTLNLNSAVTPSSVTINGGTLNANATLTTATLTLTGTNNGSGGGAGTLGGSGTVHVTGTFSASSFAEMDGSGTLVLDASSTGSTLEGGVSRTVEVSGSANIAANTSIGLGSDGGPGTLEVLQGGTLTLQSTAGESDAAINGSGSGNTFSNAGTLIVSGGGQRNVGVALSNTGTVNIQSGTLLLNAGGSSSGTVQAESGATIQFGGGGGSGGTTFTLAANSQLDDAGNLSLIGSNTLTTDATDQMSVGQTLTVNGGTLNANASFTAADFTLTGTNNGSGGGAGLLSGSGTVDVSGTLTMSGFDGMEGSGTTILDAASTGSTLEGGLSRTLEIGGSASIQSNNAVTIGGEGAAGTLEILSGGTLTLLSGSGENSNAISNSGSGNSVSNTGTLIESGSGQRNIAVALSNSGTIEVQSGTLDVTAAVSGTGSVQISGGGVAEFGNTFNENVAFSGAGTLELAQSYSGTISSFDEAGTSDTLGLALSAARSGDAFTVTPNYNGTTTTLTVTDTTHTGSASVVLAGNYSSAALVAQNLLWSASSSATGVVTVTEAAPTADTWNDTTGNWATAADWSTGVLPSASQEAVLASGAAYTVTLTGTQSPFSVLLNDGNATLSDQGTLALTGSLTLAAGAFALTSSGTIIGGTITDAGSGMVFDGGTLQGPITYEGTMNLTPAGSSVIVIGSLTTSGGGTSYLTLTGVGGTGPGAINISSNSYLYLDDSQTINNATITLSGTNAYVEDNETSAGNSANGGAPEVLTFGSSLIIDQTGASGIIGTTYDDAAASNIVNDGTINAQAGTLYIASGGTHAFGFTNAGAITVSAGTLEIEPTTFTNAAGGSITADGGTTLYIGTSTATTWSNSGTVTIDSGAKLYMWGAFTTASLAGFTDNSTTTYLDGTLTNTGATLALGSGGTFAPLTLVSGTIIGGTITDAGSGMVFDGGTLQGPITYEGTMNLMPAGSSVIVIGSLTTSGGGTSYLTLTGVGGTGPGAINIGSNSYLYLDDSQTINNATITLSGTNAYVEDNETSAGNSANGGAPEVLTFGSSLIIDQTGASGIIGTTYDDAAASNIVNDGTINAQAGTLYIASGGTHAFGFTNAGAITVSAGTLEIEPTTFTNAAGGSITADGGTTLYIGTSTATTWSNSGTVTIDSGAKLYMWGAFTTASLAGFTDNSTTTYLDGTLTNTGATLALGSGGTFAPLTLVSGTIIGGTITDAGSGMVFDGGTLQGPITYEGTMNLMPANSSVIVTGSLTTSGGGTSYLTLTGVGGTGPGAINIGSNSYLYLDDSQTINNATITLSGTNAYVEDNETSAGNSANGGTPEVLTFGSSLIIDQTGASGIIGTTYDDAAASNIVNDGTINAQAGTLYIVSGGTHAFGFTNDGAIVISSGATAYIEPTTFNNGTGTVSFSGAGTLELGSTVTSFTETIGGFGAGAIIDLKNLSYSAADTTLWTQVTTGANAAGTLNISNGSGTVLENSQSRRHLQPDRIHAPRRQRRRNIRRR